VSESKVIYLDNGSERCLRGTIINEDDYFITIKRRDGEVRIAKSVIMRIENWSGDSLVE